MFVFKFKIKFCEVRMRGVCKLLLAAIMLSFLSCEEVEEARVLAIEKIHAPLSNNVMFPSFKEDTEGKIWMTWMTEYPDSAALQFAYWQDSIWWDVKTLRRGDNWFINWADFPSIFAHSNGSLVTYALMQAAPDLYAYDISLSVSWDKGNSWINGTVPHKDQTDTEHGFVSFFEYNQQKTGLVWLDGRNYAKSDPRDQKMVLRFATLDQLGHIDDSKELDEMVCSCCQTDAVEIEGGAIVVYRDRTEEEIRDISFVKLEGEEWSEPQKLSNDNWQIGGCPVNGPAIDADGEIIAAAWFTAANGQAKVKMAISEDNAESFGDPIIIDENKPIGRVDIKLVEGEIWVSWIGYKKGDAFVRLARYSLEGQLIDLQDVAAVQTERSTGFPRMAYAEKLVILGWTTENNDHSNLDLYKITF